MQESTKTINNRIAKNTLFMYFRMFCVVLIGLYTSRALLDVLGISDYGISNVVGGVLGLFEIFTMSMTSTVQRFLNVEMGVGNINRLNVIFCNSMIIQIVISLIALLLFETAGLWLLEQKLIIPKDRQLAAFIVYQTSIVSIIWTILINPYNALLVAHEKLSVFAYLDIFQMLYKLAIVLLLYTISFDKLVAYSILTTLSIFIFSPVYLKYCRKHFEESRFHWIFDKSLFKEMVVFASYSSLGSVTEVIRRQGMTILINLFFGPVVNAAQAVASQVQSHVYKFVSNFLVSVKPQIAISYGRNDLDFFHKITVAATKIGFFLTFVIALPIELEAPFLMNVWLVDVPEYTIEFTRLMIVYFLITPFMDPMGIANSATGKIKTQQIVVSFIMISTLPISYFFLCWGYSPIIVYVIQDIAVFIRIIAQMFIICPTIKMSIYFYFKEVLARMIIVVILVLPLPCLLVSSMDSSWLRLFLITASSVLLSFVLFYFVGLNKHEQNFVVARMKSVKSRLFKR